jgi:hypothetical protein
MFNFSDLFILCIEVQTWAMIYIIFQYVQILTDAGQYVIRFGSSDPGSKIGLANAVRIPYILEEKKLCKFP